MEFRSRFRLNKTSRGSNRGSFGVPAESIGHLDRDAEYSCVCNKVGPAKRAKQGRPNRTKHAPDINMPVISTPVISTPEPEPLEPGMTSQPTSEPDAATPGGGKTETQPAKESIFPF